MFRFLMLGLSVGFFASVAGAQTGTSGPSAESAGGGEARQIETRTVEYRDDGVTYRGYLAKPQAAQGERPGVLVVHEWWGLDEYVKQRTRQLAELGYVAFAVDMYGEGRTTDDPAQAAQWSGTLYRDREELRDRVEEGFDVLGDMSGVDDDRLAAIGYCFGGTVVIELAYEEDDDLRGVVSFHGNPMPALNDDDDIEARILVLHGDADPMVSDADLKAFTDALDARKADYRVVRYDGAVHGFTNPRADERGIEGLAYDQDADEKSWTEMRRFLEEAFRR